MIPRLLRAGSLASKPPTAVKRRPRPLPRTRRRRLAKPVSQHQPVTEGKCLACHKGHVSEQKAMLKADPGQAVL